MTSVGGKLSVKSVNFFQDGTDLYLPIFWPFFSIFPKILPKIFLFFES